MPRLNRSAAGPFRKKDWLLLAGLILAGGLILLAVLLFSRPGKTVTVRVGGRTVKTLPLEQDTEYVIEGASGGTNRLIIRNGEAWVEEASCPDKLCIGMGHIRRSGQSIICLPNEVVIEIQGGPAEDSVDGIVS